MMVRPLVGIVGNGLEDERHNALAEDVGSLLGERGVAIVNGGLGGVMRASARGAKSRGGLTVGILPGLEPDGANPYIDIPIPSGMGEMRNVLIIRSAWVIIAIGGGYGTLSEIALGLKAGKTVIGLETWEISGRILKATSASEAVTLALDHLGAGRT